MDHMRKSGSTLVAQHHMNYNQVYYTVQSSRTACLHSGVSTCTCHCTCSRSSSLLGTRGRTCVVPFG
jgi:hypothetical protein